MPDLELNSPEIEMNFDLNLKIRLRLLGQVILELAKCCEVESNSGLEDTIQKGIINKKIIEKIFISFIDSNNSRKGKITFTINWKELEYSASINEEIPIINKIKMDQPIAPQLDPVVCNEIARFVKKLKSKYDIKGTEISYRYCEMIRLDSVLRSETRKYLNHVEAEVKKEDTENFNYELEVYFKGLENSLGITLEA